MWYCLECGACPREMLIEAGLGDKTISVPSCSSGEENHYVTKLKDDGGGFEVLRYPNTKVISASIAQLLKGNGKIYGFMH